MDWGSTKQFGALTLTITAVCEFVCRAVIFPLVGYFRISTYTFITIGCAISSISGITAVLFVTHTSLMVHSVIHGLSGIIFFPVMTPLLKVFMFPQNNYSLT